MEKYHYKLKSEVCKTYSIEIFYQIEEREYKDLDGKTSLTHYKCRDLFGHKECLIGKRR